MSEYTLFELLAQQARGSYVSGYQHGVENGIREALSIFRLIPPTGHELSSPSGLWSVLPSAQEDLPKRFHDILEAGNTVSIVSER